MELLFITIGGAILALLLRYLIPHRSNYGVALLPTVGAGVANVAAVGLYLLGWRWNGTWIWWAGLLLAGGAALTLALTLGRHRNRTDEARFARLRVGDAYTGPRLRS